MIGFGNAIAKGFEWLIFENDPDKKLRRIRMKEHKKLKAIVTTVFQVRLLMHQLTTKVNTETDIHKRVLIKKKLESKWHWLDKKLGF